MRYLITGTAGFVGFHLARRLLEEGHEVVGVDGMTDYYDVSLKRMRHEMLASYKTFQRNEFLLEEGTAFTDLLAKTQAEVVIHLAAQAGVRYSIENPRSYVDSNLVGSFNVLEACRATPVQHLMIASTSSAYGGNKELPFRETDRAVLPLTLYAASKLAVEHMAHSYAHLFAVPTTVFRFFTVYGPWGRPDMALFLFVRKILAGEPIEVFNNGDSRRDFTYVDDLTDAVTRLVHCVPQMREAGSAIPHDTLSPVAPFRLVNVGGGNPVGLMDFIEAIERCLGRKAQRIYKPLQPGDVPESSASPELLEALIGTKPTTPIATGVAAFVDWYRDFYHQQPPRMRRAS